MTARRVDIVDYGSFESPPSQLFRDYLARLPAAVSFYDGGRWDIEAVLAACERTLALPRDMKATAAAIARQQEGRGAARAAARAAELLAPGATAIVTGQQAVLAGGPYFVLYKALAAIKTARLVEERRGKPVVPIFWVASDDHDFEEVRSVNVLDQSGQVRPLRYAPAREPSGQPAWAIELDPTVTALLNDLAGLLPDSEFRPGLMTRLAAAYVPGVSLSEAFARFISGLFPELVVLDPATLELKELMLPVLRREIHEDSPTSRAAMTAGTGLEAAGYQQEVTVRPGFLNLFVVTGGVRRALAIADGTVEVRGPGDRFSREEAERRLEADPMAWSPGALLRPLAQDFLLPTAAYVGGASEIAYHAQTGPSYAHFGIPRPVLLPRPGLALLEPSQVRTLEAEGLKLTDLEADPEGLVARWARESNPEVEAAFARVGESLRRDMGEIESALSQIDSTLVGAAGSARGRALHQIEGLHEKVIRALKKRDQDRADRLRRTRSALFPGGVLQERGLGFVGALGRHGDDLVARIEEAMDVWAHGHQVVYL